MDRPDAHAAAKLFARLARLGHPWAQFSLAAMFKDGEGVEVDTEEAFTLFRLAAQNGVAPAHYVRRRTANHSLADFTATYRMSYSSMPHNASRCAEPGKYVRVG